MGYPPSSSRSPSAEHCIILAVKVGDRGGQKAQTAAPKKGGKPMEEDITGDLDDAPQVRQIHILLDPNRKSPS